MPHTYEWAALRCVPRAEREEFVNVGVVLWCRPLDTLAAATRVSPVRLHALWPDLDTDAVTRHAAAVEAWCTGVPVVAPSTPRGALAAADVPPGERFRWLVAPRSTVLRCGPVHSGLTDDPAAALAGLLARLVD